MTHTVTYHPALGVIETVAQGNLTLSEAKEIISEITQLAVEKDCFLCFSDYRKATMEMSTTQIYDIPEILSGIVTSFGLRPSKFKRAIIADKSLKDYQFFETVTLNMGQHIRLFQDIDEAKKWLFEK
jgi:hypothetical protein